MFQVGVIGTNFGSKYHAKAYQNHNKFELKKIAGKNFSKTKEIAKSLEIEPVENWQNIILDPSIDVISIATPPYLHYEMSIKALENGKHILLEKPTAINATEAEKIMNLATKNSLVGMLCHEWRYYKLNQLIFNLLHNDEFIGKPELLRAQDLLPYAQNNHYGWEYNKELGGGWLGIAGSHIVDLIRYLTKSEFIEVSGDTGIRIKTRNEIDGTSKQVTAEDYFSATFKMSNDIHGIIDHIPTLKPAPPSRLIISGTEGSIYTEGSNILIPEKIFAAKNGEEFKEIQSDKNGHSILDGIGSIMHELFQSLISDFSEYIESEKPKHPNLMDGWMNQLVIDKIKESNNSKRRVKI